MFSIFPTSSQIKPEAFVWDEPLFRIITEKFTIAMDGSVNVEFKNGI